MSEQDTGSEEPIPYALRLQERAVRDINTIYVRLAELVSLTVADEWRDGLRVAIAGLATSPRRYPLVPERFHRESVRFSTADLEARLLTVFCLLSLANIRIHLMHQR